MGFPKRILITLVVGIILISVFFIITSSITKYTGFSVSNADNFKKCLNEQEIILYINTEKVSETLKDIELIQYLEYIKIKNCLIDKDICIQEDINSFPTWVIKDNKINRDITSEELSELSGCKLDE